jgi:hypothetical protein
MTEEKNQLPYEVKDIHTAIAAIMHEVGYVQKQKSSGLRYTYAGEAALISALRPAMVKHGVYVYVKSYEDVERETYETSRGTTMNATTARAVVSFVHAPSGTFIDVEALGEGADAGDKSSNKAATGAYKYALRQTFCIETGDDPDQTPSDEQQRSKTRSKRSKSKNGKPSNGAGHTEAQLVRWAKNEHDMAPAEIGKALQAAEINQFDPTKWSEMLAAIAAHAGNGNGSKE